MTMVLRQMKMIYAFLMLLFFTAAPVFAQDQPSGQAHQPPSIEDIIAKYQAKLNSIQPPDPLTTDQITAIKPIIENFISKIQTLFQQVKDGSLDKDDVHDQMKQLKAEQIQALSQILSATQLSQWQKMQKFGGHKHDGASSGGGSSGSGQ